MYFPYSQHKRGNVNVGWLRGKKTHFTYQFNFRLVFFLGSGRTIPDLSVKATRSRRSRSQSLITVADIREPIETVWLVLSLKHLSLPHLISI